MSPHALAAFPWPAPLETAAAPVWTGRGFDNGQRVLAYDAAQSHWSAELTELHEAEAGADHPIDLASRALAVRTLLEHLPAGGAGATVIDVGCSSGFVIEDIRRALPDAALIGADYLLEPLEKLGARMPELPLLQFDLRRCPLPDACVDGVTALNVLEHIDDDRAALTHIARILKPGGVAHIELPAGPHLYDIYDEHLMHHRRYRLADLLALARQCGFQVLKGTHLGCLVYPMFWFVKKRQRRLLSASPEVKRHQVAAQIQRTSRSRLLDAAMRAELALGKRISYPFGIRCIAVLKREAG
jgi:ubiquinone/menaquinone biosynthesis C-methylase UbiE